MEIETLLVPPAAAAYSASHSPRMRQAPDPHHPARAATAQAPGSETGSGRPVASSRHLSE